MAALNPEQCDRCGHSDRAEQRVVEMIVRHREPAEVMQVLCDQAGPGEDVRQSAFFLSDGERWSLAARGDLTVASAWSLARFTPGDVSPELFDRPGAMFRGGWARHLYSWTGELQGMFVRFSETPAEPTGGQASQIDAMCRLASLAIEQKNLLDELVHHAEHDQVTGLLTRVCFERMLAWRLEGGRRTALLCVNIDRFRLINDVLGHAMGSRILKLVALRLQSCLGPDDILARAGGDEFAILLGDIRDEDHAGAAAALLIDSLAKSFCVEEHELCITAGIGISLSGANSTSESLQREAGTALYHAKQTGRSHWKHYGISMALAPPERLEMEKRLRSALARDEMLLHYQPQIDLATGRVTGAEALIRWKPEGLGIIAPACFIPILEDTGLIADFGVWVLREACLQGQRWLREGMSLRIAVNVSALQFARPKFVQDVERILAETGFPPRLLELELTESMVIREYTAAREVFEKLQKLGLPMALDDFGTGHASFSHLQKLPFQRLKIDRSFVCSLPEEQKNPVMVENIVRIAKSLGMRSLAEGVDSAEQVKMLVAMGCQEAQGFYFSTPLPADEVVEFIQGWNARA